MADGGGIEPLSSFPLFYATGLEDLCGDTTYYIRFRCSIQDVLFRLLYPLS